MHWPHRERYGNFGWYELHNGAHYHSNWFGDWCYLFGITDRDERRKSHVNCRRLRVCWGGLWRFS